MKTRQSFFFFLLVTMRMVSLYIVRMSYLKHILVTVPPQIIYQLMTAPVNTLAFFTDSSAAVSRRDVTRAKVEGLEVTEFSVLEKGEGFRLSLRSSERPVVFDIELQPILSYREDGIEKQQAFALSYVSYR